MLLSKQKSYAGFASWVGLAGLKKRTGLTGLAGLTGLTLLCASAHAADWPDARARYLMHIYKTFGGEMTDLGWMHMHQGHAGMDSFGLGVAIIDDVCIKPLGVEPLPDRIGSVCPEPVADFSAIQIRYLVHGVPVSGWLSQPFRFTLDPTNPALDGLMDGIHDISLEVQGATRMDYRFRPAYLHLFRGRTASTQVPLLDLDCQYCYYDSASPIQFGSGVLYIDSTSRNPVGYPVNPNVTPWHVPPYEADTFQEEMMPHSNLFAASQMWWEEPPGTPSAGLRFARALVPKLRNDALADMKYNAHYNPPNNEFGGNNLKILPYKDGPRGVGWASPYISGQVDSSGGLVFVEAGGPLRYMKPDGELVTVAGWRVHPSKDPVWIMKPLNSIRQNEEFRGNWLNGQYAVPEDRGFHAPIDVTIDSRDESIWYVAGMDDNCIWKVVVNRTQWTGTVSVLAGDPNHSAGYADGVGTAARFDAPVSITFDPVTQMIYVSDINNNAIRKINPDTGAVTTLWGSPGMGDRLLSRGATGCIPVAGFPMECYDAITNRPLAQIEVSAAQAASGVKPEVYKPFAIRVDSRGRLVVMDQGFALIRRLDPATGEAKNLGESLDRFDPHVIGWGWLDVDRYGNSGPKDGVYWLYSVSGGAIDGEDPGNRHINELFAWLPPEGGLSRWVTGADWDPYPDGWGARATTDIPHYPWMVAVDPRGGVLLTGIGEHGITRIRTRRPTDPAPTDWFNYYNGKTLWGEGERIGGHSFAVKFGWEGHNYLGMPDAWGSVGKSDAELLTMFEVPTAIRNDECSRATVLNFIKLNSGVSRPLTPASCVIVPPPPPPASACDLNTDGLTNVNDVQLCANQAIEVTPCSTGDINRDSSCNVIDVQRVVNAALGGQCVIQ